MTCTRGAIDSSGSSSAGSEEKTELRNGGPLWKRILDKVSGIWLIVDGLGTLLILGAALWISITTGLWAVGIGAFLFEILGMLNSFYVGHKQLTTT